MRKGLLIYLAIALALLGGGFLVSSMIAGNDEPPSSPDLVSAVEPEARRGAVDLDAGDPGADAGPPLSVVRVLSVDGVAERLVFGEERWAGIASGDVLGVDDAVRTEKRAEVTLGVGTRSRVSLGGEAQVQVREVSDSVQRLGLVRGRASVNYREDGARVLRVESDDGGTVAETRDGVFTVLGEGRTVAVATEDGSVDLSAGGGRVTIEGGRQSVAVDGGRPSRPAPIPADLLLRVADPGCRVQRETFIVIRGRTSPGSRVRVNDLPGAVDVEGRFSVRLPLAVGRNTIVVTTEDVLGRVERRTFPCVTVDPGAAIEKIDIKWGAPSKSGA